MNKSIITHGAWFAIAAIAFAGGMAIKGGDSSQKTASGTSAGGPGNGGVSAIGNSISGKSGDKNEQRAADGGTGSLAYGAQKSSTALLADYLTSNDALEQNYLFAQLLLGVTPENAAQMYESLKGKLTGRDGGRQMSLFFQAWGKVDGESAIAAASEGGMDMRGGPGRGGGFNVGSVLAGWAGSDPDAAKDWLGAIEDDRQKGFLTFGLVTGLAKSDPNGATKYVLELAAAEAANGGEQQQTPWGGSFTSRYIDMIAEEQLKNGVAAATSWADSLPEGDMKSSAFDQIAENMVRTDLDGAKSWVAEHAGADYADRAVREVAEQIARDDPEAALTWANTLPEAAQAGVYGEALERWTREDAEGASQYLATMDNSPNRDSAVQSFANSLANERDDEKRDPESAAAWAATIEDEGARTETLTTVARSWMRTDQAAAAAWLPTSGLPQETQTQLIENPGGRGGDRGGDFGRGRGR